MSAAVEVEGVSKKFESTVRGAGAPGSIEALDEVSFTVHRAELFGFIGPDGAGKTTLVGAVSEIRAPVSGTRLMHTSVLNSGCGCCRGRRAAATRRARR